MKHLSLAIAVFVVGFYWGAHSSTLPPPRPSRWIATVIARAEADRTLFSCSTGCTDTECLHRGAQELAPGEQLILTAHASDTRCDAVPARAVIADLHFLRESERK